MFTPLTLLLSLEDEIKELFKDWKYRNPKGESCQLNVYKQFLPIMDQDFNCLGQEELEKGFGEKQEDVPAPYVQIILNNGIANTNNKPGVANVLLYFCVYDDSVERLGYMQLLNMMQKINERFQKKKSVENYVCGEKIEWVLSHEDSHPFYFSAMEMEFSIPYLEKEDKYC